MAHPGKRTCLVRRQRRWHLHRPAGPRCLPRNGAILSRGAAEVEGLEKHLERSAMDRRKSALRWSNSLITGKIEGICQRRAHRACLAPQNHNRLAVEFPKGRTGNFL